MNSIYNIPVVILAGGLATRLYPLTNNIPKSLISINGKFMLAHQLDILKEQNISNVFLCISHLGEMIQQQFGTEYLGIKLHYSFDGPNLIGTGGAIRQILPKLSDTFFVLYGDSYVSTNYSSILEFFNNYTDKGLMTICCNENKYDTSNVIFKNDKILVYDKKIKLPEMRYIDYGMSLFRKSAFDLYLNNHRFDLSDVQHNLAKENQLLGYEIKQRLYEMGSVNGLSDLTTLLKEKNMSEWIMKNEAYKPTMDTETIQKSIDGIVQQTNTKIVLNNVQLDVINFDTEYYQKYVDNYNKRWFFLESGKENYRFLTYISSLFSNQIIIDIGSDRGASAVSLATNKSNKIYSFDIVNSRNIDFSEISNIIFCEDNIQECPKYNPLILVSSVIFLDVSPHDGIFETNFYNFLLTNKYKGILFLDDIHLNPGMESFWNNINYKKFDITKYGHWSGTGMVIFNDTTEVELS